MRTFVMRLEDIPFAATEQNKKTIEVRLNDERRRGLTVGDRVQFIRVSDGKHLTRRVAATRVYETLKDLIDKEDFEATGGIYNCRNHWFNEINRYYSQEKQDLYGLLVIEFAS